MLLYKSLQAGMIKLGHRLGIKDCHRICNIVGTTNLGYKLDLGVLSKTIPSEYEPDHHPSLFAPLGNGIKATVTHT